MSYLTPAALERELPFGAADIGVDSTEWADLLQTVIARESARIDGWADTSFAATTASASLARPAHVPTQDLPLPKRPVQSVQSVTADGTTLTEESDYTIAATHLVLSDDAAIDAWPTAYRSVTVEWTYGHDGVPGPVEDALVRLCRNAIERIQTDGLESEATGDGASYTYRLPAAVKADVHGDVTDHAVPSYHGGVMVI